jgi:hypothetical protein
MKHDPGACAWFWRYNQLRISTERQTPERIANCHGFDTGKERAVTLDQEAGSDRESIGSMMNQRLSFSVEETICTQ